jgi:hypothetical protein
MNKNKILDDPKVFAQAGAWLCALIGVLFSILTVILVWEREFGSTNDAIIVVAFTFLTFIPFFVFVYPKWKIHKTIAAFVALVELLIFYYLFWGFFIAGD